jgi:ribose 5-phosphate isomerase A
MAKEKLTPSTPLLLSEEKIRKKLQQLNQQLQTIEEAETRATVEKEIQYCLKMLLGWKVAQKAESNQLIGLGTGTTSEAAIKAIGQRISNNELQNVRGVATSDRLKNLAQSLGITILESTAEKIDWGFDGADEVEEPTLNLIKGGGAAATAEKRLAQRCQAWIVIVDEGKMKTPLEFGTFPVMIEVKDEITLKEMEQVFGEQFGAQSVSTHPKKDRADTGGKLFNVQFKPGTIRPEWEQAWPKKFPWLIESGLFMNGYPNQVWVAHRDGTIEVIFGPGQRNNPA